MSVPAPSKGKFSLYIGGSSACETYRLYGGPRLRWLWRLKSVCEDSTRVQLRRHGIDTWTAIDSSHYTSSIHCCWRRWRHSSWRWQSEWWLAGPVGWEPPSTGQAGWRRPCSG